MSVFAYTIQAELNNDGTYKVTMLDIEDEAPVYLVINRAKITVECVEDTAKSTRPLLNVLPYEGELMRLVVEEKDADGL